MNIEHIKAVSLDLDDTLWPMLPTLQRAEAALCDWFVKNAPQAMKLYADRDKVLQLRADIMAQSKGMEHDISAIRKELIHQVLHLSGESTLRASEAFDVFFAARQQVDFFEDTWLSLTRLKSRFPLLALSNGNADLKAVGLAGFFDHALSAQSFGVAKPDAKIFLHAATLLGVKPHEVLHLGDDLHTDVQGAVDAGFQCAWVNRLALERPRDLKCLCFANLAQVCDHLRLAAG